MKRKILNCLAAFVLLTSFLATPLAALATDNGAATQVTMQPSDNPSNQQINQIAQAATPTIKQKSNESGLNSEPAKKAQAADTASPVQLRGPTVRGRDVSNNITQIEVSPDKIYDGGKTTVSVAFDDHAQKIQGGDTITVNWPNTGNVYGTGYSKTIDIEIDGVKVGTLTVTGDKAVMTFNDQINDLNNVTGWLNFEVRGSNVTQTDKGDTGSFIISGGSQSDTVTVEKPATGSSSTFYYKSGDMSPSDTDHIRWFLNINNEKKDVVDRIKVEDQIQPGQTLKLDSFDISIAGNRTDHFYGANAIADFEAAYPGVKLTANATTGEISLYIPQNLATRTSFHILYLTTIEDYDQDSFKNDSQAWYQEYNEAPVNGEESDFIVKNVNADGGADGENQTTINVKKVWDDQHNQDGLRPDSIQVQLYANGIKRGKAVTLKAANQWAHAWHKLTAMQNGQKINYTVKEVGTTPGYQTTVNAQDAANVVITNRHQPSTTSVKGIKTWSDNDNQDGKRPTKITVNLLANGQKVASKVVTAKDNWQYAFTNLPAYQNGQKIIYTVTEERVKDYTTTVDGYDLNNQYTPEKTSVSVTKVWDDQQNQDGLRPNSVKVQLYADGVKQGKTIVLTQSNRWTYIWQNLALKHNGQKVIYTVKEVDVPDGYTATVDNHQPANIVIKNHHQPSTTSVKGTKTWSDNDNQDGKRPTQITVNLLANGQKVANKVVTAKDNWQYAFTNLPAYQNGQKIIYTITEDHIDGYTTTINGYDLNNQCSPEKTSITVTKAWDDHGNQDGIRPDRIQVQLYADGIKQGPAITLNQAQRWTYTWQNLALKVNGQTIHYTVKEVNQITGYVASVDDHDLGNIIITNQHQVGTTEVAGIKTWSDNDNQDGKRPTQITVNLLADGQKVASKVVTVKDNWQYAFTNLPECQNGQKVIYTITEDRVENYTTRIDGYNLNNQYTPETTSITITKAWDDQNNQDGIRPNQIQVQLYADGVKQGSVVTITSAAKWTYTWQNLAVKKNQKVIQYTVKEVGTVAGYQATIDDHDLGNIQLTNKHQVKRDVPLAPITPSQPTKTTLKTQPVKAVAKKEKLPQTGDKSTIWLVLLGLSLITSTLVIKVKKA